MGRVPNPDVDYMGLASHDTHDIDLLTATDGQVGIAVQ